MAKYFCGITAGENKYSVSILDDNLNVILVDNIELSRLAELLQRKSITIISIDAPTVLYLKQANALEGKYPDKLIIKKRSLDNTISSKNLFTYHDRFSIIRNKFEAFIKLTNQLNSLGFASRVPGQTDKSIIESYPETCFLAMGCSINRKAAKDDIISQKLDFLKGKGIRINNLIKKVKENLQDAADTLCQAYTAYLYHTGEAAFWGNPDEGLLVIPSKNPYAAAKDISNKSNTLPTRTTEKTYNSFNTGNKGREMKVITEYCGAQYLYTNTDGIIRIDGLRPIKSYRPFTDIYEVKNIRMVQVIIGTTDGLRKVKAYLIPNQENSNSFRAANEEDKKKLDSFWGIHGDKRGYLIKFNRVDRLDFAKA